MGPARLSRLLCTMRGGTLAGRNYHMRLKHKHCQWRMQSLTPMANRAVGLLTSLSSSAQAPTPESLAETAPPQQYLGQLDRMVAEARDKPARRHPRSPPRIANSFGELPCHGCGQCLPAAAFREGISWCRQCKASHRLVYDRTLRGNAFVLARKAKWRSKSKGFACQLTMQDILDMLLEQQGKCFYSGMPMEILTPHSHWRMSLERTNNYDGYTRGNCVLAACEFNSSDYTRPAGMRQGDVEGSAQWSCQKVALVGKCTSVDLQKLNADVLHARGKRPSCFGAPYNWTLRGKAKLLTRAARQRSAKWGRLCEIQYTDVLEMLLQQEGRCFYSGVPLRYDRCHADWIVSLERLDNDIGYTRANCVLIATEFNTADHSHRAVGKVFGSAQWSRSKAMHVWGRTGFAGQGNSRETGESALGS